MSYISSVDRVIAKLRLVSGAVGCVASVNVLTVDINLGKDVKKRSFLTVIGLFVNLVRLQFYVEPLIKSETGAYIGVSLAVFNLLPIPALDGARAVFVLIEWIRRKPLSEKYEVGIQMIGFALMILLSIYVMFNDIFRLI